jgi:hypothetical protein
MAAVHSAIMAFSRKLAEADCLENRDSAERTLNKLARTFVSQLEALKRYRAEGDQTVTVQQVNVSGGQAIVGNVTQGQKDPEPNRAPAQPLASPTTRRFRCPSLRATRVFRFQSHETRRENDARSSTQYWSDAFQPALRSENPLWQILPFARRSGKKALPDARGSGGFGSSARQRECA